MNRVFTLFATIIMAGSALAAAVVGDTVYCVSAQYANCYAWKGTGGAGNQNAAWPGLAMTKASYQLKNTDVYYFVATDAWDQCIFNGTGGQTADLAWQSGKYYYNGEWKTRGQLEGTELEPEPEVEPGTGEETTAGVDQQLASYYRINPNGFGRKTTITSYADWTAADLIAQGAANDDARVYPQWSMHENPVDLYALYAAYDDNNLYLMWEFTNVQDVVAKSDDYPLSQGILYQTMELPMFLYLDTHAGGAGGYINTNGGTLWASDITYRPIVDRVIGMNTKMTNIYIYGTQDTLVNAVELYNKTSSGVTANYGLGIKSTNVYGINAAGKSKRTPGDVKAASETSKPWVDFNTKGHQSSTMDFHYELYIPLSKLGTSAEVIAERGIGILLVSTFGLSGMDCLPYDLSMSNNAALAYSQDPSGSKEKEDADHITTSFAYLGACPYTQEAMAVETTTEAPEAKKVLRNGELLIIREGKTYTATGAELR